MQKKTLVRNWAELKKKTNLSFKGNTSAWLSQLTACSWSENQFMFRKPLGSYKVPFFSSMYGDVEMKRFRAKLDMQISPNI